MTLRVPSNSLMLDAREMLASWTAPNYQQDQLRREFLSLALSEPDAAFRGCTPDHITASTLIFSADASQVALLFHPKFGRWLQMGGHCEPSDLTLSAAALREATEESGLEILDLDPLPVLLSRHRVKCWPDGHHFDVQFIARAQHGATLKCSVESVDLRWFDLADVRRVSDESVADLLAAALARLAALPLPAHVPKFVR